MILLFLSDEYLTGNGISIDAIYQWRHRVVIPSIELSGTYIPYSNIPAPSKAKLPSEEEMRTQAVIARYDSLTEGYYIPMYAAFERGFVQCLGKYKSLYPGNDDKPVRYAKRL